MRAIEWIEKVGIERRASRVGEVELRESNGNGFAMPKIRRVGAARRNQFTTTATHFALLVSYILSS